MGFINTVIGKLKNEFITIASDGMLGDIDSYVDTGCYALNALISSNIKGGIPAGRVTALAGQQSVGKTYFCMDIIKNFLDKDERAEVVLFESESAITSAMLVSRDIDTNRILNVPVESVEQFRTECVKIINEYLEVPENDRTPLLFVLDSLGNLSTLKEIGDISEGNDKQDMTRARVIKGAFRVITLRLGKAKIPMIITNHTYKEVGAMYPQDLMSGGSGLLFSASTILFLSKSKDKDGTEVIGNIIRVKNYKNRLAKENTQVELKLSYETGLSKYYGLLDFAIDNGYIESIGRKIKWLDDKNYFKSEIEKEPEKFFTNEVIDKFQEFVNDHFRYGNEKDIEYEEE